MRFCFMPAFIVAIVLVENKGKFVDTAPFQFTNDEESLKDTAVKELQSLKNLLVKTENNIEKNNKILIFNSTSFFSDDSEQDSVHKEVNKEVERNGKLVAKVSQNVDISKSKHGKPKSLIETKIEIPSKGIHHTIKNDGNFEVIEEIPENKRTEVRIIPSGIHKLNSLPKIKYTSQDMAEYIFWTGDEKGVALTIQEFLQQGLMSRQEAISFLQSIKTNLDLLELHYQQPYKTFDETSNKLQELSVKRKFFNKEILNDKPKENFNSKQLKNQKLLQGKKSKMFDRLTVSERLKQNSVLANLIPKSIYNDKIYTKDKNENSSSVETADNIYENDGYYSKNEELSKTSGFLEKDNALQEIIFDLAKIIFSESLIKGNVEAQKAMRKFVAYLKNEVDEGRIPPNVQKNIFDILLSAFLNALSFQPELLNKSLNKLQIVLDQDLSISDALRQLLTLGMQMLEDQSNTKEFSEKIVLLKKSV